MKLNPTVKRRGSVAAVCLLVVGLVVAATQVQGYVVPEPDLHDGGIWVTNDARGLVGRTNAEIATVDTKLSAGTGDFELLQSGEVVVLRQQDPSALAAIDPAQSMLIPGPELAADAQVAIGGSTAALFDPDSGGVFVVTATSSESVLALDPTGELEPIDTLPGDATLAVGVDGLVHVYDHESGALTTWDADGAQVQSVPVEAGLDSAVLSPVGDRPVLLDEDRLLIPGQAPVVADVGARPVLQEPGPAADGVLVAGDDRLVEIGFDGAARAISDDGTGGAARPARVGSCIFGGWGGDPTYVQACGDRDPVAEPIAEMDAAVELQFRINRERVTLNSLTDGNQLLFGDDDPVFIDNEWAEALSDEIEVDPEATEELDEQSEPTCESPKNGAPIAEPDEGIYGTRRDRPVVVYPLRNDQDPDCDVLAIESVSLEDPDAGVLGIIGGGQAVQVDMASDVDRLRFEYTVSDGRGGEDTSTVTVDVVDENRNEEPVLSDEETVVVTGGTVTHNVLSTAYDPDGDVLRLLRAEENDTATGTVKTNARGDITFTAGNNPGNVDVAFVVGDGRGGEQTGMLSVTVVDRRENQAPDAQNDAEQSFTGREVVFDVLDNDLDANDDRLSLVRATSSENAQVRWDPTSPEIRVSSDQPGTVNVVYRVTDGQATDEAVLRVDFAERGEKRPPVAVRDEVLLSAGEPAFVPVLDNDVDPDGEVLVVLGVSDLPDPAPVEVTVLQRSVVKVTAPTALTEPLELGYRISDGTSIAEGRILLEPAPVIQENRPPVVAADEYTVRAGGIVAFPVLSNDSDPDGDALEIEPPPLDQPDADTDGRLFLSDDGLLRYEAPKGPKATVRLIYSVRDTAENIASAELVVHVLPPNPDRNQPPVAPDLIGRTIAGQTVKIAIPVTTMDPDGDTVTLLGIDDPPQFGTVTEVRSDELVYAADDEAAGTDEFTYRVVDQYGAEATATILVGVAGRPDQNSPPIPTDDTALVRAGSTVAIPVLANDFDPDADPLRIAEDDGQVPRPAIGSAEIDGSAIRYTAPEEPGSPETSFRYTADDGRGGQRSAMVTLTFQDQADNRAPVATDDATDPQADGTDLLLPLTENDEDPDQDPIEIVETSLDEATITPDGQAVELVMGTEPLQFTYVISDGTDISRAAVSVPALDPDADQAPIGRLDDDIEVDLGSTVTVDVLANDEDPEGDRLQLFKVVGVRHGSAAIVDDQVEFTASEEDYVGDAGFSYVVGDDPDPAVANTTVASARIRINGEINSPPTFTELSVELARGSERTIDLQNAAVDPDDGDELSFGDLDVSGDGFSAELDGDILRLSAPLDAEAGSAGQVDLVVSDGEDEVAGSVQVQVTGSDEPLASVGGDTAQTVQGQPVTIEVLANDANPFPETPLRLASVGNPTGGAGQTEITGDRVTFTPDAAFFGDTTFAYTVIDATGTAEREVSGTVAVTVVGRPAAPPAPTCIGGETGRVRVQWVAPSANGSPISGYVLRVSGSGAGTGERTVANASTQDVGGLTNGAEYTFQVGAVNEAVGGAAPNFSPASPPCVPDEVPGQPAPPVTEFGDGSLRVRWTPPANAGSPIEKLILTNTTSGTSKEFGPTVTDHLWEGLENGTSVRFTLTAENALGRGPVSGLSTGDGTPAGTPAQPAAPSAQATVGARDGFLDVDWTWSSASDNGDPIKQFRITSFKNGARDSQVVVSDTRQRSQTFTTENGQEYQFSIEAQNKVGWSAASPRSKAAVSAGKPLGTPTVQASEGDTQSVLTLGGSVQDNGAPISRYEYDVNNNGNWKSVPGNRRITGLRNGTAYRFRVRAVNAEGAGKTSAASNAIRPYGRPTTPDVSRTVNGRTIRWTWTASNGNGRQIVRYQYSLDGGGWQNTQSRNFERRFGYAERHTLRVRAVSAGDAANRRVSGIGSASGRTVDRPEPAATAFRTGDVPCDTAPQTTCTQYNVRGVDFPANTTVTAYCQFKEGSAPWGASQYPHAVGTNGAGAFTGDSNCHVGVNTQLRYEVRVNGNRYYTPPVTK